MFGRTGLIAVTGGRGTVPVVHPTPNHPAPSGGVFDDLLVGLDDAQYQAVTAPAGPLVVVAGAGSGKTTTLTRRIAYQVLRGDVAPEHVLAVTHTTKAAAEIRERLVRLDPRFAAVSCSTVHAAAWRVVRQFHREAGFETVPELVSSTLQLVRAALRSVGKASVDAADVLDTAAEFEWAGAFGVGADTYQQAAQAAGRTPPWSMADTAAALTAYQAIKRERNVVDFADTLSIATELLAIDNVAARVRAVWRAVVVDEFQDTDRAQARFLAAVRGGRPLWTVVGDPRQTIYSFKGADPGLLRAAMREPGASVVHLSTSWRCSRQILEWANVVVGVGYGPPLVAYVDGPTPSVQSVFDDDAEVAAVVVQVQAWARRGVPLHEIAILFRFNATAARLEAALTDAGVAYHVVGGPRFLERPEVVEVLRRFGAEARLDGDADGVELLAGAAAACGFDPTAQPSTVGAVRTRWESVRALLDLAAGFDDLSAAGVLDALLAMARTGDSPGVALSTVHAAKGLEWDAVVVFGAAEGSFPSSYASSDAAVEEERRLFYVALTRARRELVVLWSRTYKRRPVQPSRFLTALPGVRLPSRSSTAATRSTSGTSYGTSGRGSPRQRTGRGSNTGASGSYNPPARDQGAEAVNGFSPGELLGVCGKCGDRLVGAPARKARRCSGACLDGVLAARWAAAVAWRAALLDQAGAAVPKLSDKALFRFVVTGAPGVGWPPGLATPALPA